MRDPDAVHGDDGAGTGRQGVVVVRDALEAGHQQADDGMSARRAIRKALPYQIVCISLYNRDVEELEEKVRELKARGIRRANKSWLIRLALSRLDIDTITEADRP